MTKTAKINYIAKLDGQIVGTRASHRAYTHAVVIQWDEQAAREVAYGYKASKTDRSNFNWYAEQVEQGVNHEMIRVTAWRKEPDYARLEEAKAQIEGGFDAYVERQRQRAIDGFEKGRANGGFKPGVAAWNGRRDLAEKEANKYRNYTGNTKIANVWVVEAEAVAKPVKLKENKHLAYGPR